MADNNKGASANWDEKPVGAMNSNEVAERYKRKKAMEALMKSDKRAVDATQAVQETVNELAPERENYVMADPEPVQSNLVTEQVKEPVVKETTDNVIDKLEVSAKTRNLVKKNIQSPKKTEQAIKKVEQGKKPSQVDQLTAAFAHFGPQLIGGLIGSIFEGEAGFVAGAEGAAKGVAEVEAMDEKAKAGEIAGQERVRKAGLEERGMLVKEKQADTAAANLDLNALAAKYKNITGQQKESKEMRELLVPIGDKVYTGLSKEEATKLRDQAIEHEKAVNIIGNIKNLGKNIDKFDRTQLAKLQANISQLIGALRIDIVGPGAFTDSEREFIKEVVGDPSKFFGMESIEQAKLDEILNTKIKGMQSALATRTIEGVDVANKKARYNRYQQLMQKQTQGASGSF